MRKWLNRLALVLALPALLLLFSVGWIAFRYVTYNQQDDPERVKAKSDYLSAVAQGAPGRERSGRPNILIIFYDDLGFGDLGFTGSRAISTPNIDGLADNGFVFGNFHAAAAVCSPSRAALLTGRLPPRAGMPTVAFPSTGIESLGSILSGQNMRIPGEEITLAEVLKADGYRSGMVGKWHIGDVAPSLPNLMGFESFYGALYSNDMEPFALYRNDAIAVKAPADQTKLDRLYTQEAVDFIERGKGKSKPFFLYFAHNFPHEPLHVAPAASGKSDAGLYGDVVESLDRGVGRIVAALKDTGQFDNTIIILTSDNGPWFEGSPGLNRGRKGQTFEGGTHVPFLLHWPAKIAPGQRSNAIAMGTDIFPTLLDWLAIPLPADRAIDGVSLGPLLEGTSDRVHDVVYYYAGSSLLAICDGRFKYHVRQPVLYVMSGTRIAFPADKGPWLFDLNSDPDESYDVSGKYPDVAARLKHELDRRVAQDRTNLRGWKRIDRN